MTYRKWTMTFLLGFILATTGCGQGAEPGTQPPGQAQQAGGATATVQAQGFTKADLQGVARTVRPGDGSVYVLNFWATWCPPCRAEMPEIQEFAASHASDLRFYAVNLQEKREEVQAFLTRNGYAMPILLDEDGSVSDAYRVRAIPTTLILNGKGEVILRREGMTTARELEDALKGAR
ncbi:MAG: TlpA family protein disulfide reductase [Succiniclasticum sp.]|nr:TlpA family protein disulfide reductase [Succiniclasticum sp.]MDY6304219.1 TlpA disulfide reductase family protein [Succiniclasticum sp.]MDY6345931.1 TlpA disulfide reductase family protein [Succiniclasticum sp.]